MRNGIIKIIHAGNKKALREQQYHISFKERPEKAASLCKSSKARYLLSLIQGILASLIVAPDAVFSSIINPPYFP